MSKTILLCAIGLMLATLALAGNQTTIQQALQCKIRYCPTNSDNWDQVSQKAQANYTECYKKTPKCQEAELLLEDLDWNSPLPQIYYDCVQKLCKPNITDTYYYKNIYTCERSCESSSVPQSNIQLNPVKQVNDCIEKCPVCLENDTCKEQKWAYYDCQVKNQLCLNANKYLKTLTENDTYPFEMYQCKQSCKPQNMGQTYRRLATISNTTQFKEIFNCEMKCIGTGNGSTVLQIVGILGLALLSLIMML